ncbi:helix-turn-helix domain-containing protein [Chitinophaga sp. CF418]|uniref:helix-turn-helix domain-containing protein n=1 Tax=Chitinophaga sp. CF418 TaxID=1855287 RepID=UPI000915F3E0|nr:helix-turn-helix transcriptional regulator [Chitinophaga sp. CF418]SHN22395.1 DNA-binding transcriptional regulator, XRE-family HTH domain [Chitinophaga sp. CF418]
MNLGKAIVKIREKTGMKQVTLASKVGISATALSFIESNKSRPSEETLNKIAKVFDTDVWFIYLTAIDPETDMSEEKRKTFNELFPGFQDKLLSFIK